MPATNISMAEAAARLGVSVGTVIRWIDKEGLPAHQIGRTVRIPVSDFEEWYARKSITVKVPSDV